MNKNKSNLFICIFFVVVISAFTLLNLWEFLTGSEPDGRKMGLGELDTVQNDAVTIWGGIQKVLGKKQAYGTTGYEDVTLLSNGYATLADPDRSAAAAIEGIEGASALAGEIGADFIYVAVPSKQYKDDLLPQGTVCYANEKYDTVMDYVKSAGIDYIDMREVLLEQAEYKDDNWFGYFYKSDHHWRNKGAFVAYNEICRHFKLLGYETNEEYLNSDNYSKKTYENVFLGTHARMAGPLYAGLDDYELWLPKFDTSYDYNAVNMGITRKGNFEEALVYYENLASYSYDYYAYYAYLKEDYDFIEIKNELNRDAPKVVIVRDSSAVAVSAFLVNQCSELDMIDLRYLKEGDSAISYIREKKPDIVIYMFSPGYLGNESAMVLR